MKTGDEFDDDGGKHDVTLIAGAAGAWQRGYDAGRRAGAYYSNMLWAIGAFIAGVLFARWGI
jgi:hypothetical protein